jgi:hypothetical protein
MLIMIVIYDRNMSIVQATSKLLITIVNNNRNMFIVQSTG